MKNYKFRKQQNFYMSLLLHLIIIFIIVIFLEKMYKLLIFHEIIFSSYRKHKMQKEIQIKDHKKETIVHERDNQLFRMRQLSDIYGDMKDVSSNMEPNPEKPRDQNIYQRIKNKFIEFQSKQVFTIINLVILVYLLICYAVWVQNMENYTLSIQILEIVGYIFSVAILIVKIVSSEKYNKKWLIFDAITILIGFLGVLNFQYEIKRYFKAIRTFRLLLIIQSVQFLREPTTKLINALTKVANILIPMILLIYIYAVVGLYAFSDFQYSKCREKDNLNILSNWTQVQEKIFLCGQYQCPILNGQKTLCLNPIQYDIQPLQSQLLHIQQGNGLLRFSNIFYALFSTFKQTFITGSSRLITLYKQALNEYFVEIYFYSYIYLISYICLSIFYSLIITAQWDNSDDDNQSFQDSKITVVKIRNELSMKEERFSRKKIFSERQQIMKNSLKQPKSLLNIQVHSMSNQLDHSQGKNIFFKQPSQMSIQFQCKDVINLSRKTNKNSQQMKIQIEQSFQEEQKLQIEQIKLHKTKTFLIIRNSLIILCCINLCIDYHMQSQEFKFIIDCIDFCFLLLFLIELTFKLILESKTNQIQLSTKLEIIISLVCTAGIFYEISNSHSVADFFYAKEPIQGVFRSFKYLRVILILLQSQLFKEAKLIFISTAKAVFQIKNVICLWLLIVCIFSIVGYHLHSNKTKVNEEGHFDIQNGKSFQISFDSKFDALILTLLTFYNEQWDFFMFQQYLGSGVLVVVWQLISICIGMVVFSKYFMSILMQELNEIYDEQKENLSEDEDIESSQNSYAKNQEHKNEFSFLEPQKTKKKKAISFSLDIPIENQFPQQDFIPKIKSEKKSVKIIQSNQKPGCFNKIYQKIKTLIHSKAYKTIFILCILVECLTFINLHPHVDKTEPAIIPYVIINQIFKCYFFIDLLLNLIVFGFIKNQQAYIRRSWVNVLNLCINIIQLLSFTGLGNFLIFQKIEKIRVLRIIFLIYVQYESSNNMKINCKALLKVFPKIFNLLAVKLLLESFFALILVKMYKNQFYSCYNYFQKINIATSNECILWGGDWVQSNINTSNIFNSILFLFSTATMEGWVSVMQEMMNFAGEGKQPIYNSNKFICIFFVVFFFFANLVLLNVFVGLSIYNFKTSKEKDTGESNLSGKDKIWWSIKTQIYRIQPIIYISKPSNCFQSFFFVIINSVFYKIFQGLTFVIILISMSFYRTNMSHIEKLILKYFQEGFAAINVLNYLFQIIGKGMKSQNSLVIFISQHLIVLYSIGYLIFLETQHNTEIHTEKILGAIFIALQLTRYLRSTYILQIVLFEVPFIKKLMNSFLTVLPPTVDILFLMVIILFIYSIIGMEIFAFLRPNSELDQFNQNYSNFPSALYSLIKFSTMQSPIQQMSDASQQSQPNFICSQVYFYEQYLQKGQMGCGNKFFSVIFFISFHIFYSLILTSTLLAVIADSYSEVKLEQSAYITKFVLYKVQKAWSKIDTQATGYIPCRQFWMFTTNLIQIYDKQFVFSLNDTKKRFHQLFLCRQKFLENMNLPIYQDQNGILCLQFHEVIEALTLNYLKNYIGVSLKVKKTEQIFRYPDEVKNKKTKITSYNSGQINSLIILKSLLRKWHGQACNKETLVENILIGRVAKHFINLNKDK